MNTSIQEKPGLSLQTDLVFKAVFGRDTKESKSLLIDLLNAILNRSKEGVMQLAYDEYSKVTNDDILKDKGVSLDIIIASSGLSKEEVDNL